MKKFIKVNILMAIILAVLLISGCVDKIEWLDKKAGEGFDKFQTKQQDDLINFMDKDSEEKEEKESKEDGEEGELNQEQKEKIDQWLEENNLNRYGDPVGTFYTGGTPLFNGLTGESVDRFEYILNKYPDILKDLN
ncbi:MAG: hypothetical protein ABIE43_02020 [Patescibacteria group bacterium]